MMRGEAIKTGGDRCWNKTKPIIKGLASLIIQRPRTTSSHMMGTFQRNSTLVLDRALTSESQPEFFLIIILTE